jgi:hypothetical protein
MPEGVTGADFTIPTVYQEFALLSASYVARPLRRSRLGIVDRGRALVALAFDGPFAFVRHHMLIFTGHRIVLVVQSSEAKTKRRVI